MKNCWIWLLLLYFYDKFKLWKIEYKWKLFVDIVFGMKKKKIWKKFIYHIYLKEIENWYIDRFQTFLYFVKNKKEA